MGTKNSYFVLLVLCICFLLSLRSFGQLSVELGNDTTYCTDMTTVSIPMGLKVNIKNGVEPFTYAWEVVVVPYGILKPLTASDILNDSTLVSPTIKDAIWAYTGNRVKFVLNITDQAGHRAKDSIHVGFSTCGCVTGYRVIELNKGDSVWLDAGIPQGSVAALYFVPAEGLTNPQSSATWCKPSVTTNYFLSRVDTFGCTCTCHAYEIRIIPTTDVSILDPSLKWNIGTHCVKFGPINPYDKWTTSFLHTEGDTLMNEKHYKKLVSCADSLCGNKSLKSFIREESDRVFLANKTEELILYDFNLQRGDTMIMDFLRDVSRHIRLYIRVDSVKSMVLHDQKERIAQYVTVFGYYNSQLGDYSLNDIFVEGIGSLKFGLEYPINLFVTGDQQCYPALLCFYSGEGLIYSNSEINSCYLSTGIQQFKQPDLVQVISNNHGMLEIQLTEAKVGKLFVFDLNGKQVLGQVVNRSGTQFCLPSSGVYVWRFESVKGKVQTGKVMVK